MHTAELSSSVFSFSVSHRMGCFSVIKDHPGAIKQSVPWKEGNWHFTRTTTIKANVTLSLPWCHGLRVYFVEHSDCSGFFIHFCAVQYFLLPKTMGHTYDVSANIAVYIDPWFRKNGAPATVLWQQSLFENHPQFQLNVLWTASIRFGKWPSRLWGAAELLSMTSSPRRDWQWYFIWLTHLSQKNKGQDGLRPVLKWIAWLPRGGNEEWKTLIRCSKNHFSC